jgi:hypothetical protein
MIRKAPRDYFSRRFLFHIGPRAPPPAMSAKREKAVIARN